MFLLLYIQFCCTAPSAAPLNVTGSFNDSTSLLIMWSPPPLLDQNGDIISYNVTYRKTDSTDNIMMLITPTSVILISDLNPFTNYSVTVAAFTVGIGPFSDATIVMTDSASELHVVKLPHVNAVTQYNNSYI